MLQDSVRMNAYYSAIVNNASDFKDKAQLTAAPFDTNLSWL
jgi:hypothetical protein